MILDDYCLGIGTTSAIFHAMGKMLLKSEVLIRSVIDGRIEDIQSL